MNWMRMNGLGQGAIRPLLTGGNTAVAKSSTNLGRVSSLRKMHAISSLEDRVPSSHHYEFDAELKQRWVICDSLKYILDEKKSLDVRLRSAHLDFDNHNNFTVNGRRYEIEEFCAAVSHFMYVERIGVMEKFPEKKHSVYDTIPLQCFVFLLQPLVK
ncbi:hypothetical protein NECAME_17678, partial [Necator americanus]